MLPEVKRPHASTKTVFNNEVLSSRARSSHVYFVNGVPEQSVYFCLIISRNDYLITFVCSEMLHKSWVGDLIVNTARMNMVVYLC